MKMKMPTHQHWCAWKTQNFLFVCDIKRYAGGENYGWGRKRKTESHGRSAWKLNGVPFPCRDCHFRFLYLYKSQSKPKIHAEHEALCVCVCSIVVIAPRFYGSQKVEEKTLNVFMGQRKKKKHKGRRA